ncbi:MAG: ribonuclease HII [Candidatus Abyssobacteria bacterium SURF_17]|uniref:Ribonuclease HII n=1 Tax=Candidatus Abyssobacteria bacterium SURF_17 TaxID=2093361 RepID=A0A419F8J8_9BACT|nr:MAG: ribonuclease HII [Candidatus Abyssubacteria bacterium SURF_17]
MTAGTSKTSRSKPLESLVTDERTDPSRLAETLNKKTSGESRTGIKRPRAGAKKRAGIQDMFEFEQWARARGYRLIAGVDEVGRGPLAGPVVAAAVILPEGIDSPDINDSKLLDDVTRRRALGMIAATADIGVGVVSAEEIDRINIHKASLLAMRLALEDLVSTPEFVLVDGRAITDLDVPQRAIVKGDRLSISIAAASIVAKVVRDEMMIEFDKKFPQYKFAKHKGYSTPEHLACIREFGISPIHRRSFAPVRERLCPPLL